MHLHIQSPYNLLDIKRFANENSFVMTMMGEGREKRKRKRVRYFFKERKKKGKKLSVRTS